MTQPTVPRANDLWANAATELPDDVKRNINFNRPDKLNILTELHATAEHLRQRSVESRWKYARKNGEIVIVRDVVGKIVRWVDTFKQVGDAAVQYDPGHAALPWAGIRFLLQVAVNDIDKYGSVVEDLARVAELICRFALVEELYLQGTSKEIKALELAVVKLYAHTLVFLSTAKQYLEQGTIKRITKSAFLTESDLGSGLNKIQAAEKDVDRCMALVNRMDSTKNHAKLIDILARIDMPLRRMDDSLNKIHDDLQASKRTEIIQWLSPEPYIQHHKQTTQGVLTGTGQWLLSDPIFKRWKDDSASSILWLHGIPGSGKSKLVSVVIEDALARYKAGDSPQPVFFYCSRNPAELTRSDPKAILASLARQLSCLEPGRPLLQPSVHLYREKEAEGFASGPLQIDESLKLVLQLIAKYPLTTIVIDAMDECDPQKRHELLKALEKILQNSSSLVKIFVSSRNDQDIVLRLRNYPNLEIDSQRNARDIARFVNEQVEELIQDGRLLSYSDSKTEMKKLIVGKVIEGAAGMFRWASMQLQYLCEFNQDDDIKSSLGRLPPDLNALYDELYKILSTKPGRVQAAIFKNTLCWLLCARKTLSTKELLCAVSIDSEPGSSVKVSSKDLVLKICNNFIVFDPQLDTFRFAHLSVREYLEQRPEYGSTTTNALIAEMCLWTVLSASSNIATEKLLLQLGYSTNALPEAFEQICTYADIYWPEHCKSAGDQRCSGKLKKMLQHMLSSFGGPGSTIALWNERLKKHLAWHVYGDVQKPLQDTFPRLNSETCIGIFVSCAFDFGEFIGAEVEGSARAMDSLNWKNRSPLHVATRNGSCASLVKLLLMDQPRTEITKEVMVAAAGNYDNGKEVMALLLDKRGDEVKITQEVVVTAARNPGSGEEIMALLLDKRGDEVHITQEVVVAAAQNAGSGEEVMTLLLDKRGEEVHITQEVVVAAAGNYRSGKKVMALLLDKRGDEVHITQEVVVAAAGNYRIGKEVMALLLDECGDEVHITQEAVVAAAQNAGSGEKVMALLLDKCGDKIYITQEIVVAAIGNYYSSEEIIALILDKRGDEVHITQEVVVAAAGNYRSGREVIALLLKKRGDEVKITQEVVVAAAQNASSGEEVMALLLDKRGDEVHIAQEIVVSIAQRCNATVMALLLDKRGDEVYITQEVVVAAAQNASSGKRVMALLLDKRGDEFHITQDVVIAAAQNASNGEEIMALLLDKRGDEVHITQEVVVAAAQNAGSGEEVMTLLLDKRGEEVHITQEVVVAAAQNAGSGEGVMALLLDKRGEEVYITQEVVVAAAGNYRSGEWVMALLLDKRGDEVHITQEVVVAAAQNAGIGEWVMALLLDKRKDEVHITQEVVVAAAQNAGSGEGIMALLLDECEDEVYITQEVVVAAAGNYRSGKKVMALLLDKRGDEVHITQEVVVAAARNAGNGKEVMALLLDKRGDEVHITQDVVIAAAGNEDGGRVFKHLHQTAAVDTIDAIIQSAATSG